MARTNSPDVSGPRKRKPSSKARTNADLLQAQKWKKTLSTVNKSVTAALTRNKTATGTSNTTPNELRPSKKVSGGQDKHATDSDDIIMVDLTLEPPPNITLDAAADGSDNENNSVVEDMDNEDKVNDETDLEAAEESAEMELGIRIIFVSN